MTDAVKRHGRVLQCGSQQRSDKNFRIAQWGMGTEATGPVLVRKAKAEFPPADSPWNTATEFFFECVYQSGVTLTVATARREDRERRVVPGGEAKPRMGVTLATSRCCSAATCAGIRRPSRSSAIPPRSG